MAFRAMKCVFEFFYLVQVNWVKFMSLEVFGYEETVYGVVLASEFVTEGGSVQFPK